jgi:guanylate kinase
VQQSWSGWHVYSTDLGDGGPISATFNVDNKSGVELVGKLKPVGKEVSTFDKLFEMKVRYFENTAKFVRDKFKVVLITADDSVRINRVKHRNNFTEEKIKNIMAAQMSQEKKAVLADYVVDTSNQETKHAAEQLMKNKFKKVFFSAQMV